MVELLHITLKDLFDPVFYINHGGIWIVLFIIFAETGLMIGFFLPGDSLLFVSGIYSKMLIGSLIPGGLGNDFLEVMILFWATNWVIGLDIKPGLYFSNEKIPGYSRKNIFTRLKNFTTNTEVSP